MIVVMMGFIFVAIISIIILLIYLFRTILDIVTDSIRDREQCLQLKFSQFKKFYSINPGKYDLWAYTAVRIDNYKYGVPRHVIKFNIIDTFRYIHFKKEIEKNMINVCMSNKMKEYLSLVQNDIDELNQEAQEAIEKAKREVGE